MKKKFQFDFTDKQIQTNRYGETDRPKVREKV